MPVLGEHKAVHNGLIDVTSVCRVVPRNLVFVCGETMFVYRKQPFGDIKTLSRHHLSITMLYK